jgi:hypothetical protein
LWDKKFFKFFLGMSNSELYGPVCFVYNNFCCSSIQYGKINVGFPLKDRQFLIANSVFCNKKKTVFVNAFKSTNCSRVKKFYNNEMAFFRGYYLLEKVEDKKTKIVLVASGDYYGFVFFFNFFLYFYFLFFFLHFFFYIFFYIIFYFFFFTLFFLHYFFFFIF